MSYSKHWLIKVLSLLTVGALALAACGGPATTQAPAATDVPVATQPPTTKLGVGIVLPTKDEPRWLQDEARFKDALVAAGYEVEILFSQGDSAKEKANVEALIAKGIKVLIITP
ncbi:MAG: substrate-binding domain-containing protein, partial [Chloroflexi bacterium]|nr:substrate-binding domain-containing protein [Chloroflexota bacterium]